MGFMLKIKDIVVAEHVSLDSFVIGRTAKNTNFALQPFVDNDFSNSISRRHAEISFSEEAGTFNLKGLTAKEVYPISDRVLKARDVIDICGVQIHFQVIRAKTGSTQAPLSDGTIITDSSTSASSGVLATTTTVPKPLSGSSSVGSGLPCLDGNAAPNTDKPTGS